MPCIGVIRLIMAATCVIFLCMPHRTANAEADGESSARVKEQFEYPTDTALRSALQLYSQNVERIATSPYASAEERKGVEGDLQSLKEQEDNLIQMASRVPQGDQSLIFAAVSLARMRLHHRGWISLAQRALDLGGTGAALVSLNTGNFIRALIYAKENRRLKAHIMQVSSRLKQYGPPQQCAGITEQELCQMLGQLLYMPAIGSFSDRFHEISLISNPKRTGIRPGIAASTRLTQGLSPIFPGLIEQELSKPGRLESWKEVRLSGPSASRLNTILTGSRNAEDVLDVLWKDPDIRTAALPNLDAKPPKRELRKPLSKRPTIFSDFFSADRRVLILRLAVEDEKDFIDSEENWIVVAFPKSRAETISIMSHRVFNGTGTEIIMRSGDKAFLLWSVNGTGSFLSAWVLIPSRSATHTLVSEYFQGTLTLADLHGEGYTTILVSHAVGEGRFLPSDCNQCPRQRETVVFSSANDGSIHELGKYISWIDFRGYGDSFFGLNSRMSANAVGNRLHELQRLRDAFRSGLLSNADSKTEYAAAVSALQQLYDAEDFDAVFAYGRDILGAATKIADFPERAEYQKQIEIFTADAAIRAGNISGASEVLSRTKPLNHPDLDRLTEILSFRVASAKGDIREQQTILARAASDPQASAWMNFAQVQYLLAIGNYMAAESLAENFELKSFASVTPDLAPMLLEGITLAGEGKDYQAAAALTAALREAFLLRPRVLMIAAEIANRHRMADVSKNLLDAAFAEMTSTDWMEFGNTALLYYGQMLRVAGRFEEAKVLLQTAAKRAHAGQRLVAAAAYEELASLAEERGELGALGYSRQAFDLVLSEQRNVGVENDKLAFVVSRQRIGEHHLERLIGSEATVTELVDALERWRAQVIRSLRPGMISLSDRIPADVIGSITRDGNTYVAFHLSAKQSLALVSEGGKFRKVSLLLEPKDIASLRAAVEHELDISSPEALESILSDRPTSQLRDALRDLYQRLIQPLELKQSTGVVIIAPDENTAWVPWTALWERETRAEYSGQALVISPSILMGEAVTSKPGQPKFIGILNDGAISPLTVATALPDLYPRGAAPRLPRIGNARREVTDIAGLFLGQDMAKIVETSARREVSDREQVNYVLQAVGKFDFIHVAAHGIFNVNNPMGSAVFLADAPEAVIRPSDFYQLELSGSRLISLSACQTGVSKMLSGGEALGFVRGLLLAGAHRVLLAQWNVEDSATAEFFTQFYKAVSTGLPATAAYREAIRMMKQRYKHPFYWAAFSLYATSL